MTELSFSLKGWLFSPSLSGLSWLARLLEFNVQNTWLQFYPPLKTFLSSFVTESFAYNKIPECWCADDLGYCGLQCSMGGSKPPPLESTQGLDPWPRGVLCAVLHSMSFLTPRPRATSAMQSLDVCLARDLI